MAPFLFRFDRIEHELAMGVGMQETHTGTPLPGLLAALVLNFSPQGGCLILPKLVIEGKHIFYTTLDNDDYNLLLYCQRQDGLEENMTIAARPVWLDSSEYNKRAVFKIGVQFLESQKELYKQLKRSAEVL